MPLGHWRIAGLPVPPVAAKDQVHAGQRDQNKGKYLRYRGGEWMLPDGKKQQRKHRGRADRQTGAEECRLGRLAARLQSAGDKLDQCSGQHESGSKEQERHKAGIFKDQHAKWPCQSRKNDAHHQRRPAGSVRKTQPIAGQTGSEADAAAAERTTMFGRPSRRW